MTAFYIWNFAAYNLVRNSNAISGLTAADVRLTVRPLDTERWE
jgi:hypothetical protein